MLLTHRAAISTKLGHILVSLEMIQWISWQKPRMMTLTPPLTSSNLQAQLATQHTGFTDSTATGSPSTGFLAHEQPPINHLSGHLRSIAQRHHIAHTFATLTVPAYVPLSCRKQRRSSMAGSIPRPHAPSGPVPWRQRGPSTSPCSSDSTVLSITQQAQRFYGTQLVEITTCPYCGSGPDDADHALNTCNLAEISHLIKLRHDNAVHLILAVIKRHHHFIYCAYCQLHRSNLGQPYSAKS